ncbi:MAG: glycoside hydrolase family 127 protein [Oscillospiraceae bacterium]|jgi:hypothetical protein|nr:glycoside hydrolase family 127 protein [Oscillospiraceae bacterium]
MPNRFAPLPLSALRPAGWLQEQLTLAATALRDRWLTLDPGNPHAPSPALAWALLRVGLPLAALLDDEPWLSGVRRRMDHLLTLQGEDGCLLPDAPCDWAAQAVCLQTLIPAYGLWADKEIPVRMLRFCRYLWGQLPEHPLTLPQAATCGELLSPVLWLYDLTGKRFLLELARALQAQGTDWTAFCHTMPLRARTEKAVPWDTLRTQAEVEGWDARRYHAGLYQHAHAAHIAMGLKTPALIAQWTGGIKHEGAFDVGFAKLMKHHGVACGLFTGDDLLAGASPSRGVLSAAAAGMVGTLCSLLATLGHAPHGDLLETIAFNALPALFTPDMRGHQRLQQPNQVQITRAARDWYSAGEADTFFAPDAGDAESAALHQAWPLLAGSLWMASRDGGLGAMCYAPCQVRYRLGGQPVRLDVQSAYPFDGTVRIRILTPAPAAFPLHLRIPDWAQGATLAVADELMECAPGAFASLDRTWRDGDILTLTLPMPVTVTGWYHQSGAVTRGPLVFALPLDAAPGENPGEWLPASPWAYALLPDAGFSVVCDPQQAAPFGMGQPVAIEAICVPLPDWGLKDDSALPPPIAPRVDRALARRIRLVPYGGTTLRISQFPVAQAATHSDAAEQATPAPVCGGALANLP